MISLSYCLGGLTAQPDPPGQGLETCRSALSVGVGGVEGGVDGGNCGCAATLPSSNPGTSGKIGRITRARQWPALPRRRQWRARHERLKLL